MTQTCRQNKESCTKESVLAAGLMIARYRDSLDRTLALPEWQDGIAALVEESDLPRQRQGISSVRALLALPLESKRELVERLLKNPPARLKAASAQTLIRAWGVSGFSLKNAFVPSTKWTDLKQRLSIRQATSYRSYKNAQSYLYTEFEYIPKQAAREMCRIPSRREDCQQEGSLGLLQAIDRIKPNMPFASYAFLWARRRVRNYLMISHLPVTAPVNLVSQLSIADSRSAESATAHPLLAQSVACLQQPYIEFTDDLETESWRLEDDAQGADSPLTTAIKSDLSAAVRLALNQLTPKQREVLALRFGILNREAIETLQGIATATGISRQQVTRREQRALAQLERIFSPLRHELA
jgi:RNA polymerase sigma factor (sigma-70 family)